MKKVFWCSALFAYILMNSMQLFSQGYPKIGEKMIEFKFNDLVNSSKKEISNADFRGKWLVIDFWTRFCGGCIASFPKINRLSQNFGDSVAIIMVGAYEKAQKGMVEEGRITKEIFNNHRKKYNLRFVNAFDSTAVVKFDIDAVPLILVVDPQGKIVAKTYKLDSVALTALINRKPVDLPYSYSRKEKDPMVAHDFTRPLMPGVESGANDTSQGYLTRVLFTTWAKTMPANYFYGFGSRPPRRRPNSAEVLGMDLPQMLRLAYFGKVYWSHYDSIYRSLFFAPVIESKRPELNSLFSGTNKDSRYCFSLDQAGLPADGELERKYLKLQLDSYFGISVSVEEREVDVYRLVIVDQSRLERYRSKGGDGIYEIIGANDGIRIINTPIDQFLYSDLIKSITTASPFATILDETGIDFNIDLTFRTNLDDLQEVCKGLRKIGLDLVKGKSMMKCIVVRDADSRAK